MKPFGSATRFLFALSLAFATGCGRAAEDEVVGSKEPSTAADTAGEARATTVEPSRTRPRVPQVVQLPPLPVAVELPAVTERSELLQRIPKSALIVVRLPHVEDLAEAYRRTPLEQMLAAPESSATRAELAAAVLDLRRELQTLVPDLDALPGGLEDLRGEAVLALVSVDAAAFLGRTTSSFPLTCALLYDAGGAADRVDARMREALGSIASRSSRSAEDRAEVEAAEDAPDHWRSHVRHHGIDADIAREGSKFLLHFGPDSRSPSERHPLALLDIEDSFLAADLARGTRDLSRDGKVVVEAYLNLEPVWGAVSLLAPSDVKAVLTQTGVTSIRGLSAVAALGETGIHEELFLMSPGGQDLLTRAVTNRPLDPTIARFLAPNAASVTLGTFDPANLFRGIEGLLPETERHELANTLTDLKKNGFDLIADVVENIGPTFAMTGDVDPATWFHGDDTGRAPNFTLVAQVQDGTRLRGALDALLQRCGVRGDVYSKDIHGFMTYGTNPITVPGSDGQSVFRIHPHWYVGDQVFVFSLSRDGLARALAASWDAQNQGPAALEHALAREKGAFAIGVTAPEGRAPSTMVGRHTSLGLELSTRDGSGIASAYSIATCGAILSAVAIPGLVATRTERGERQATDALRAIRAAQVAFKAAGHVDQDADGDGEYGTLGELSGAIALRNGRPALDPALLASSLRPGADGLAHCGSYLIRVDLSNRLTRRIDFDEREFCAYAWPAQAGSVFHRAFAIDADGKVYVTDNDAHDQEYAGIERMPKPDAARRVKSGSVKLGGRLPPSLDGGFWRDL